MTVYLIPNMKKRDVRAAVETVARCLRGLGAQVLLPLALEETFEGQDAQFLCDADAFARCDVAVTVGGDGTILHAAKRGLSYHRPLLGVNLGRMGFLATAECGDSAKFERLVRGDWREDRRAVLSVRCRGKRPFESVALNDLVIAKTGIGQNIWATASSCRRPRAPPPTRSARAARCWTRASAALWSRLCARTACTARRWSFRPNGGSPSRWIPLRAGARKCAATAPTRPSCCRRTVWRSP